MYDYVMTVSWNEQVLHKFTLYPSKGEARGALPGEYITYPINLSINQPIKLYLKKRTDNNNKITNKLVAL